MCDCISEVNAQLAEHNTTLVTTLFGSPLRCTVGTDKRDSKIRGRAKFMLATFCPFCGERYPEMKMALAAESAS